MAAGGVPCGLNFRDRFARAARATWQAALATLWVQRVSAPALQALALSVIHRAARARNTSHNGP